MTPTTLSLAHPSVDPPTLIDRTRQALGWSGSEFLVGLRGYDELMETLEVASDVEGLARIGDPTSPPVRLLRALNASGAGLSVGRVATLDAPWRWARIGEGTAEITGVALRQQAYADVVGALGRAGVSFRVLPDDTTTEALLDLGRTLGSAVLDVDEVPADAVLVPGYLDDQPPLTYGLLTRRAPELAEDVVVWLSMQPERESAGTLMAALQRFSDLGLNLDFLHSDPLGPDVHSFYLGFRTDPARVDDLQASLREGGFTSRVLAAFAL
ncbi:hypothetical protein FE634_04315 [Nocardioides dongxiaopingii]|uniref:hypothetical protein n=1 Tax=Nocardioides sp. S-1144 TaxID=2582905 RepID=UPI00110E51E3|nr:hypothetical protein [Nocardioides sp. S-1144]QCW49830.1 hypothetical protein FE634_04315 [Nocardioides sp. S-1144]